MAPARLHSRPRHAAFNPCHSSYSSDPSDAPGFRPGRVTNRRGLSRAHAAASDIGKRIRAPAASPRQRQPQAHRHTNHRRPTPPPSHHRRPCPHKSPAKSPHKTAYNAPPPPTTFSTSVTPKRRARTSRPVLWPRASSPKRRSSNTPITANGQRQSRSPPATKNSAPASHILSDNGARPAAFTPEACPV
jgi:hypothetical protein